MIENLNRKTASAFAWSLFQSWSVKFLSLVIFFVLARHLNYDQMGLAQSITVLLALVTVLTGLGFQNAIVQREGLRHRDVNVPFFISISIAGIASLAMYAFAHEIARHLKASDAAPLIRVAAVIPPITAANGIAIAMLRRELNFKPIAQASFLASLISGCLAIALVIYEWGPMALVVQAATSGLITALFIWTRPVWRPSRILETRNLKDIFKYSSATFGGQLVDFASGRIVDIIILARYGLAALGVYAVGAKLYLTLLELLAASLVVVGMSAMAKLLSNRAALKELYLRFIFLSACITLPLFVGIAALSNEICIILFGDKWAGAAAITRWLSLLGAVQVVQFFNGAALDATGHPRRTLAINIAKLATGVTALSIYPADDIAQITVAFVMAQLCVTPLSFGLAMHATSTKLKEIMQQLTPGLTAAVLAYFAVTVFRNTIPTSDLNHWQSASLFGTAFALVYILTLLLLNGNRVILECRAALRITRPRTK